MHPLRLAPPASLAQALRTPWAQRLVLLPAAGFALVTAACAPTVYAMNAYPDDRVIVVPQYVLVLTVALWGLFAGRTLSALLPAWRERMRFALPALAVVVVIAAVGLAAAGSLTDLPAEAGYAAQWDARHRSLQAQAEGGIVVLQTYALDARAGLMELSEDPQGWVNQCMAGFYGVARVEALAQEP